MIAIIGGGPGGYEAALVARQCGAEVVLVERDGPGGSAVLTDCVPSKALIAVADVLTVSGESGHLGVTLGDTPVRPGSIGVDIAAANARIENLAAEQSADIGSRLEREGVSVIGGQAELAEREVVVATDHGEQRLQPEAILIATGARPRLLPGVEPDGERIFTWEQLYRLQELPERLIVIGSGVTGAEFAAAYRAMGCEVVLVSSRDRVLPTEDADAAEVIENAFQRRGVAVEARSRAASVVRTESGVAVTLTDGRTLSGSHCLLAVGSIPNTDGLGLTTAGVAVDERGFIQVDRVSRTSNPSIYAAGDCTGVMMLASVAAMQGRIAMWHLLGQAVHPLDQRAVSSNVFTDPEIATVGYSQAEIDNGDVAAASVTLPLRTNPRAKMQGIQDGFVKVFCRADTRVVIGGVVVAPQASELIYPLTIAVDRGLTVAQLAEDFTVYPSLTGSIAEAARKLRATD